MSSQVLSPQVTPELSVWVRLLRGHAGLAGELSAHLQEEHGLTINDYEVLLLLSHAENDGLRRIDLAREVTPREIAAAEAEANRVVWDDIPVSIRFAESAEVAKMALRKESVREGALRLIEIEGIDLSACGGTHVNRTGVIGNIAVASWEKFRGGTRIEFVCGGRALAAYRLLRDSVAESVQKLSISAQELPAGIDRLQSDARDLKRQLKDMQSRLASFEADALASRAESRGPLRVVIEALEGWDQNGLKSIASAIVTRPAHVAVLVGSQSPSFVVVARSADSSVNAADVLKELTTKFGGKGGGRPELAQGGGLTAPSAELVEAARKSTALIGPTTAT